MFRILIAAFLVISLSTVAVADLTITQKVVIKSESEWDPDGNKTQEQVQTILIKGKKVRIDTKDQKPYTVADFDKGQVYTIDPEKKTFSQVALSELDKLRDMAYYQVLRKLDQIEQLAPEQKAAIELIFGTQLKKAREELANKDKPTKVEVEKPEETREIAGYTCKQVIIKEEGNLIVSVWLTDKIEVDIELAQILSAMALFSKSVKEKVETLEGFSLKTTYVFRIAGQGKTSSSEAVEVKSGDIPAEKFAIPEGFKKEDSPIGEQIKQYDKWKKAQAEKAAKEKEAESKPQEKKPEEKKEPGKEPQPAPEPPDSEGGENSK